MILLQLPAHHLSWHTVLLLVYKWFPMWIVWHPKDWFQMLWQAWPRYISGAIRVLFAVLPLCMINNWNPTILSNISKFAFLLRNVSETAKGMLIRIVSSVTTVAGAHSTRAHLFWKQRLMLQMMTKIARAEAATTRIVIVIWKVSVESPPTEDRQNAI